MSGNSSLELYNRFHTARQDFAEYCAKHLVIRTKEGNLVNLRLNRAQRVLQEAIKRQLRRRGFVRMLLPKARQLGTSTYISARGYFRVTGEAGLRAFQMTHRDDATHNLFRMIKRYHDNIEDWLKPSTKHSNRKELNFGAIDSSYAVATAGGKDVGRSDTIQFLHGSEAAYWPNAEDHATGLLQAVPLRGEGTEIYIESTASGPNGWYYKQIQLARKGRSDFEVCFLPWHLDDKYRLTPDPDMRLDEDELEYMESHGLDMEQMAFRRAKIVEFGDDDHALFRWKREYPATIDEAFESQDVDSFIKAEPVLRARRTDAEPSGPTIYGLDPAWLGEDDSALWRRNGRVARRVNKWSKRDSTEVAHLVAQEIMQDPDAAMLNIDTSNGFGAGVYDQMLRMPELMTKVRVNAVMFGGSADNPDNYVNKRSEIWGRCKDWLSEAPYPDLPDDEAIQSDLVGPWRVPDSRYRVRLATKDDMARKGLDSPDDGDALALTFAYHLPGQPVMKSSGLNPHRPVNWRAI